MPRKPRTLLSPILDTDLLDSWELALHAANRRPGTIMTYRNSLKMFRRYLSPSGDENGCSIRVADITQETCQRFLAWALETRKQATAQTYFRSLAAFWKWCIQDEILDDSPMRKLHEPATTDKPAVLILTDDQIARLLAVVRNDKSFYGYRDYALLRILLTTGARREEIANLELADVSPKDKVITVRRGKGGEREVGSD